MFILIDQLQKSHSCYYIDFLPEKMDSPRYFEIEEFFLNTYLRNHNHPFNGWFAHYAIFIL